MIITAFFLGIAGICWFLTCNNKTLNKQLEMNNKINKYNHRCIDMGVYDSMKFDYDDKPDYDKMMWRLVFFRNYDDLIVPRLKQIMKDY
jgi:hypothetical protein